MKIDYDKLLTTAERVHIRILQVLNVLLTIALWLLVLGGGYVSYSWFHSGFRISNVVFTILLLFVYLLFWAFLIWMCLLCKRLRIAKRLLVWLFLWIPVVNFGLALYVRGLAKQEIDHTLHKIRLDQVRVEKQICSTRYPLLLVHGVGFRDFHYFNYWGRIPRELVRNGAKVYYGHQEAWGTVEDNGQILKDKIMEIVRETGCGKVNIIAHSKGGLDARYVISGLGMAPFVASLTTINTPHRGSRLVDFLKKLPDGVYRGICRMIDLYFGRLGDKNPNAYVASRQLSEAYAREFNEKYPDVDGVYYQSYASLMKHGFSSKLLCVPYWILKALDTKSDGLVTVESAMWADFQGVVTNRYLRGISHGDMIDLTREDYRGFKVLEFYIQLVTKLKEGGF
ncbi:MAG: triacylglycerol lipase [Hungatella sp.]|jgi:triacylglycerol lipase|nr:triacylglycerol lipase [Hungatella sp.]